MDRLFKRVRPPACVFVCVVWIKISQRVVRLIDCDSASRDNLETHRKKKAPLPIQPAQVQEETNPLLEKKKKKTAALAPLPLNLPLISRCMGRHHPVSTRPHQNN